MNFGEQIKRHVQIYSNSMSWSFCHLFIEYLFNLSCFNLVCHKYQLKPDHEMKFHADNNDQRNGHKVMRNGCGIICFRGWVGWRMGGNFGGKNDMIRHFMWDENTRSEHIRCTHTNVEDVYNSATYYYYLLFYSILLYYMWLYNIYNFIYVHNRWQWIPQQVEFSYWNYLKWNPLPGRALWWQARSAESYPLSKGCGWWTFTYVRRASSILIERVVCFFW